MKLDLLWVQQFICWNLILDQWFNITKETAAWEPTSKQSLTVLVLLDLCQRKQQPVCHKLHRQNGQFQQTSGCSWEIKVYAWREAPQLNTSRLDESPGMLRPIHSTEKAVDSDLCLQFLLNKINAQQLSQPQQNLEGPCPKVHFNNHEQIKERKQCNSLIIRCISSEAEVIIISTVSGIFHSGSSRRIARLRRSCLLSFASFIAVFTKLKPWPLLLCWPPCWPLHDSSRSLDNLLLRVHQPTSERHLKTMPWLHLSTVHNKQ